MRRGTVRGLRAPGHTDSDNNDVARRVVLMHEVQEKATVTDLAPTAEGRVLTLMETAGYIAALVRDNQTSETELRNELLTLTVQTQIWIAELDRNSAA